MARIPPVLATVRKHQRPAASSTSNPTPMGPTATGSPSPAGLTARTPSLPVAITRSRDVRATSRLTTRPPEAPPAMSMNSTDSPSAIANGAPDDPFRQDGSRASAATDSAAPSSNTRPNHTSAPPINCVSVISELPFVVVSPWRHRHRAPCPFPCQQHDPPRSPCNGLGASAAQRSASRQINEDGPAVLRPGGFSGTGRLGPLFAVTHDLR